MDQNNGGLR